MNNEPVKYSVYRKPDESEMVSLLGETFSKLDPPALAAGVAPAEFEAFVRLFCPKALSEGLTIVARSSQTGEMCGALLTEDSASGMPDGLDQISSKFNPIFDILGQLDAEYRKDRIIHKGKAVHLFLLGVAQRFSGQGIAQRLVSECLENAQRLGYSLAITEATNKTSQHIFRKSGFNERVKRSYKDHQFEGQRFFASIAAQGGPILMDKVLAK